jgi:RNA polymerase sigma factor (sigma-70 family)
VSAHGNIYEKARITALWAINQGLIPASDEAPLRDYIFEVIAKNPHRKIIGSYIAVDYIRAKLGRTQHRKFVSFQDWMLGAQNPEPGIIEALDAKKLVEKLLRRLPKDELLIIHLLFFEGYLQKEVADFWGVTESAISLRVRGIMEKLRKRAQRLAEF